MTEVSKVLAKGDRFCDVKMFEDQSFIGTLIITFNSN